MKLGIFDSGVGGLTVARAIRDATPTTDIVYLGDTARVPYGTKSGRSVERYALQSVSCLVSNRQVDAVVIACNTASAVAVEPLREHFEHLPIFGVVDPGASAAIKAVQGLCTDHREREGQTSLIGVLATEGTVRGGAYRRAIESKTATATVVCQPSQMLVSLAEEGWLDGKIADLAVEHYLKALYALHDRWPDAVILGCTHFPLLKQTIRKVANNLGASTMVIVDSSTEIAQTVKANLGSAMAQGSGAIEFLATDSAAGFSRIGEKFLGYPIAPSSVEIVDLSASAP